MAFNNHKIINIYFKMLTTLKFATLKPHKAYNQCNIDAQNCDGQVIILKNKHTL